MIGALAVIAALAAEALAVYTGAELFASGYNDNPGAVAAVTFVLLALVAYGLPRTVGDLGLSGRRASVVMGVVTYVAIYGAMRIEFAGDLALWDWSWVAGFINDAETTTRESGPAVVGGAFILAIWVRSSWRSREGIDIETITRSIGIPFAIVTSLVVFGAASDRVALIARGGVAFYVVAVSALALSQSALSGATIGTLRAGTVTATLLAGTAAATAVCVVIFGIVFGVLGDQFGDLITRLLNFVLLVIFTPIAWLLEKIISFLLPGQSNLPPLEVPEVIRSSDGDPGAAADGPASKPLIAFGRMLILFFVVGGGILIVAFFSRLRAAGRSSRLEAAQASSAGSLGADLAAGLRSLFSRGPRTADPAPATPAIQLYRQVVARAERSGRPRGVGETAEEFAPALQGLFRTPVTDEITFAFEQARYAGREPDPALLAELERRWRETHID